MEENSGNLHDVFINIQRQSSDQAPSNDSSLQPQQLSDTRNAVRQVAGKRRVNDSMPPRAGLEYIEKSISSRKKDQ